MLILFLKGGSLCYWVNYCVNRIFAMQNYHFVLPMEECSGWNSLSDNNSRNGVGLFENV